MIHNGAGGASGEETVTLHIKKISHVSDTTYSYSVVVHGIAYTEATDTSVKVGDTIFCKVVASNTNSYIDLNGYTVSEASQRVYAVFGFAATRNTAITLDGKYIRITT